MEKRGDGPGVTESQLYGAGTFVKDVVREFERSERATKEIHESQPRAGGTDIDKVFEAAKSGANPSAEGPGYGRTHYGNHFKKERQNVTRKEWPVINDWDRTRAERTANGGFFVGRSIGLPKKLWQPPERTPAFYPAPRRGSQTAR